MASNQIFNTRNIGFVSWLIFVMVFGGVDASAQSVTSTFCLTRDAVTVNEPVWIEFQVRNDLAEQIQFDLGFDRRQNFEFRLTETGGAFVLLRGPEPQGMGRRGKLSLGSGETYTQKILLTELYQFQTPGLYRVVARMTNPIRTQSGITIQPQPSQEMTLKVDTRDPQQLEKECRMLADSVDSENAEAALEAATALGYVRDLVAVAYLQRIASQGHFVAVVRPKAVQGLARIANAEGIENVVSKIRPPDPDLVSSVRTAMQTTR